MRPTLRIAAALLASIAALTAAPASAATLPAAVPAARQAPSAGVTDLARATAHTDLATTALARTVALVNAAAKELARGRTATARQLYGKARLGALEAKAAEEAATRYANLGVALHDAAAAQGLADAPDWTRAEIRYRLAASMLEVMRERSRIAQDRYCRVLADHGQQLCDVIL